MKAYLRTGSIDESGMVKYKDSSNDERSFINYNDTGIQYDGYNVVVIACDDSNIDFIGSLNECLGLSDADFCLRCPTAAKKIFKITALVGEKRKEMSVLEWEKTGKPEVVSGSRPPVEWLGEEK